MYDVTRRQLMGAGVVIGVAALLPRIASAAEPTLALYNGQHRPPVEALIDAFTKATGIEVVARNGNSAQLASQIIEEGDNSPADVFWSEESPSLVALDRQKRLAQLDPETLKQIPATYVAKDGTWIGAGARCRVVVYNKSMVDASALPASVLDFATEAWRDKVAFAANSGAFQQQVVAVSILKGRDAALAWLKGLKQFGRVYNSDSAAVEAVESGEIEVALSNNYYWYALQQEIGDADMKSAIDYVGHQDPGTLVTVSGAGVLKTSKNSAAAQRFVAFIASAEGQAAIVGAIAEYPLRPGIVSPFPLKPFAELDAAPVTPEQLGDAADALALLREADLA